MTDARTITRYLGGEWHGPEGVAPCPVCQPEKRRDQRALSIADADGKLLMHCFKSGCGFREILASLGLTPNSFRPDHNAAKKLTKMRTDHNTAQLAKARSLWNTAKPIQATKAEAYLRARGITAALPETLRFLPDIYHGPSRARACAMVAKIEPSGGIHRTFFDKQGNRLLKSPKMMLGPCSGGAVRLSEDPGPLVVAEGIETGLSLLSGLLSGPGRVWAALSTSGMKSLALPHKPSELVIATDGDPAGRLAGEALEKRAFGLGWHVKMLPAPDGADWNDIIQQRGAA